MLYGCRAASDGHSHLQQKPSTNGPIAEASQLQHLQRDLSAAEREALGARAELLRACQQLEAAAADAGRCKGLEHSLQVPHNTQSASSPPLQRVITFYLGFSFPGSVLQHVVCSTDVLAKYKRVQRFIHLHKKTPAYSNKH
jgi:hypothetical protein